MVRNVWLIYPVKHVFNLVSPNSAIKGFFSKIIIPDMLVAFESVYNQCECSLIQPCFGSLIFGMVEGVSRWLCKWRVPLQIIPLLLLVHVEYCSAGWNFQMECCCLPVKNVRNTWVQTRHDYCRSSQDVGRILGKKSSVIGNFIDRCYICFHIVGIKTTCCFEKVIVTNSGDYRELQCQNELVGTVNMQDTVTYR